MTQINMNDSSPLYQQVYEILSEKIENSEYLSGERIPTENELCEQFNVSRITIRKALKILVNNDVLEKIPGKGTFVKKRVYIESELAHGSFTRSCMLTGVVPSTKVISCKWISIDKAIANKMKLKENDKVIRIERLRITDNIPAIFETDYFNSNFEYLLTSDLESIPLMDVIKKKSGIIGNHFVDTFEVVYTTEKQSKYLNCPEHYPLIGVNQVYFSDRYTILYYNEQCIRSDIYKYVTSS